MGSPYPLLPPCSPFSTWQQVGSFKNQSDHVISLLKTFQGPPLTLGIKSKGFPLACGPYTIWPCLFPHLEPPPHLVPALQLPWRFLEPSLTFLTQDLCTCYLLCLEGPSPNTLLWLVPPRLPCHLLRAPPPPGHLSHVGPPPSPNHSRLLHCPVRSSWEHTLSILLTYTLIFCFTTTAL